jgi:hypothetical protein
MLNKLLSLLALVALLSGCAATRLDANVHTTGTWPAGRAPGSFAFERLPSQQANVKEQDAIEAATLPALALAGFKPADGGSPDVLVQVAARLVQGQAIYADPFFNPAWGGAGFYGGRWRGAGWGYGAGWGWGWPYGAGYSFPYYAYELSMLILDARTKQPLYETRAQSEGAWPDEGTWEALSAAALRDFPYAAVSPRRVTVELAK